MIEAGLRGLLGLANGALLLSFLCAWFQRSLAHALGMQSGAELHLAMAGVSTLLALFTDVCVLFYFIGTAVWIRDRGRELWITDRARAERIGKIYTEANRLKARTFPFATFGLLLGLFAFILGGATQVGAVPRWVHATAAFLYLLNEWSGWRFHLPAMRRNVELLDLVSSELEQSTPVDFVPKTR